MKFKTLTNREVSIEVSNRLYPIKNRESCRSKGQFHLGQQLQAIYGNIVLEEFRIPDSRLSIDFLVPLRKLAFEFQGEQHDEFNILFHNTKADFERQKDRDKDKRRWCEINGIHLVEVRDNRISVENLQKAIEGVILDG